MKDKLCETSLRSLLPTYPRYLVTSTSAKAYHVSHLLLSTSDILVTLSGFARRCRYLTEGLVSYLSQVAVSVGSAN